MNRFSGKSLAKFFRAGLIFLALIVFLSGSVDTALAADDPAATAAKSSQVGSLDIPGSFKDLPEARDAVTAKRSAEEIVSVAQSASVSALPVIDAEKGARSGRTSTQLIIDTDRAVRSRASDAAYADSDLVDFHATAYCLKGRTASGINTRPGVIAADPSVLPLGTVVHLRSGRYTGTYTVMDTGGLIKGRRVDVYVPTYKEAVEFGRRQVKIKVIGRYSAKAAAKGLLAAGL
jgi:3D (Asp-Asp-Asp) domain-containing protein